jgi:hypothetical protein
LALRVRETNSKSCHLKITCLPVRHVRSRRWRDVESLSFRALYLSHGQIDSRSASGDIIHIHRTFPGGLVQILALLLPLNGRDVIT